MKKNILKLFIFITTFSALLYVSIVWATPGHANANSNTSTKTLKTMSYLDKTYSKQEIASRFVWLQVETTCFDTITGLTFNPYTGQGEN
jgi:hypothetical protein